MSKNIYDLSVWKSRPAKLAILVPCREYVYSLFTAALTELVKTTTMVGIDVHVIYDQSTILLSQRERLAKQAMYMNSDYALWLDSDMLFPSTTALRLMKHDLPVVCGNYMKRSTPLQTVAYEERGDWDSWVPLESQEELQEVEGIGMGCMMMKTEILHTIEAPFFEFEYYDNDWHGEDFYFQKKLRNAGHKILVDMNLSRQVRHIGQWAFGPSIQANSDKIVERRVKKIEQEKKEKLKNTPTTKAPPKTTPVQSSESTTKPTKKVIKKIIRKKTDAE